VAYLVQFSVKFNKKIFERSSEYIKQKHQSTFNQLASDSNCRLIVELRVRDELGLADVDLQPNRGSCLFEFVGHVA
jgi:hypothetical protein